MKAVHLVLGLALLGTFALATPAIAGTTDVTKKTHTKVAKKETVVKWDNEQALRDHVEKHAMYPTTKADFMKACENMTKDTFSEHDKKMVTEKLASYKDDYKFTSAEDVKKALGLK